MARVIVYRNLRLAIVANDVGWWLLLDDVIIAIIYATAVLIGVVFVINVVLTGCCVITGRKTDRYIACCHFANVLSC